MRTRFEETGIGAAGVVLRFPAGPGGKKIFAFSEPQRDVLLAE